MRDSWLSSTFRGPAPIPPYSSHSRERRGFWIHPLTPPWLSPVFLPWLPHQRFCSRSRPTEWPGGSGNEQVRSPPSSAQTPLWLPPHPEWGQSPPGQRDASQAGLVPPGSPPSTLPVLTDLCIDRSLCLHCFSPGHHVAPHPPSLGASSRSPQSPRLGAASLTPPACPPSFFPSAFHLLAYEPIPHVSCSLAHPHSCPWRT